MDFAFSEEQQAVADLAKRVFKGLSTPERLGQVEQTEGRVDHELWKALAQAELLGCALRADVGGSELGFLALCLMLEQAGRRTARVPLVPTLVAAALPIDRFGTEAQRMTFLPAVARGEAYLTAALDEVGADVDLPPATRAVPDGGGGYTLHGHKPLVPVADRAAAILVPASTPDGDVVLALVAPTAPGLSLAAQEASDDDILFQVDLDGVPVGAGDVLPGDGAATLAWTLDRVRAAMAAEALGVASEALILTAKYTAQRQQFGRPIATFQAVSQRAGDAWVDVEAMRLTTWQAAWRLDQELEAGRAVTIAKLWAAEGGHRVTAAAQHLHGGMGFDKDYPLWRHTLRSKRLELSLGPAAAHLAALGRSLAAPT